MDPKAIGLGVGITAAVGAAGVGLFAIARHNGQKRATPSEDRAHDVIAGQYLRMGDVDGNGGISYETEAIRFHERDLKMGETYSSLRPLVIAADMAFGNRDGEATQAEIGALVRSYDPTPATPMTTNEAIAFSDEFGMRSGFGGSLDEMRPFYR